MFCMKDMQCNTFCVSFIFLKILFLIYPGKYKYSVASLMDFKIPLFKKSRKNTAIWILNKPVHAVTLFKT